MSFKRGTALYYYTRIGNHIHIEILTTVSYTTLSDRERSNRSIFFILMIYIAIEIHVDKNHNNFVDRVYCYVSKLSRVQLKQVLDSHICVCLVHVSLPTYNNPKDTKTLKTSGNVRYIIIYYQDYTNLHLLMTIS